MKMKLLFLKSLCVAVMMSTAPVTLGQLESANGKVPTKPKVVAGLGTVLKKVSAAEAKVIGLYDAGKYKACLKAVEPLLEEAPKGSGVYDTLLFISAASHYYSGAVNDAVVQLSQHSKLFGENSPHAMDVAYMLASSYVYAYQDDKALPLLADFLKKYSDPKKNPYFAHAHYDLATVCFMICDHLQGMRSLSLIEKNHKKSTIYASALALHGNMFHLDGDNEQAELYYEKALAVAIRVGNKEVEPEVLYYLCSLIAEEKNLSKERARKATQYYDAFFKKFPRSVYKTQLAAAAIPAMRAVGREREALSKLLDIIVEMSDSDAPGLEHSVNHWIKEYLKGKTTIEPAEKALLIASKRAKSPENLEAVMAAGLMGAAQRTMNSGDEGREKEYAAAIERQIDRLDKLDRSKISVKSLVACASALEEIDYQSERPRPIIGYFYATDALKRMDKSGLSSYPAERAKRSLVKFVIQSKDAKLASSALKLLDETIEAPERKAEHEEAMALKMEIFHHTGQHAEVIKIGQAVLQKPEWRRHRFKVRFILGNSYRSLGKREDAIEQLGSLLGDFSKVMKYSAPACKAVMEMMWERNQVRGGKQDRQVAYELGRSFYLSLQATVKANAHRIPRDEKKAYQAVRELYLQYEDSGQVTPKVNKEG